MTVSMLAAVAPVVPVVPETGEEAAEWRDPIERDMMRYVNEMDAVCRLSLNCQYFLLDMHDGDDSVIDETAKSYD